MEEPEEDNIIQEEIHGALHVHKWFHKHTTGMGCGELGRKGTLTTYSMHTINYLFRANNFFLDSSI